MNTSDQIRGHWVILVSRYGRDTNAPSHEMLASAIRELYFEDLPTMTEGDYEEHGSASLRVGSDEGPMYVLEVTRSGTVRFEEWADQDFETPRSPPRVMVSVPRAHALQLWASLSDGRVGEVRNQAWNGAA